MSPDEKRIRQDAILVATFRWICLLPAVYGVGFLSGLSLAIIGQWYFAYSAVILFNGLWGLLVAPNCRILATGIAFVIGNWLYYGMADSPLPTDSRFGIRENWPTFAWPTIITLIVAIVLDVRDIRRWLARRNRPSLSQ